jgi:hypothetical protein
MKDQSSFRVFKIVFCTVLTGFYLNARAQNTSNPLTTKNDFWQKVQIGGGIGLSIGSGYTDILVAPGAIYNFNPYFAAGLGLQGSYVRAKYDYEAYIYGGSVIGLFNPVEFMQLSVELEQMRVNRNFAGSINSDNFWNTGLFLGAGYRSQNVTIGARYNVLYNKNDFVYSDAFMPFIRVYF